MVKPIDLRIGNLVLDSNDKWCIVETISHQSVRLSAMDCSYNFESKDISEIKPIALTSSLLESSGFSEFDTFWAKIWGINGVIIVVYEKQYEKFAIQLGKGKIRILNYLHELQNGYHFLTNGEEL